jgi:hypothetical protein
MPHEKKSRLHEKAVSALLRVQSIEQAATETGIVKRTMLRWLADASFAEEYLAAKERALRQATGILAAQSTRAANCLAEIANGKVKPHQGATVAACIGILRLSLEAFALESIEARIHKLQAQRSDDV